MQTFIFILLTIGMLNNHETVWKWFNHTIGRKYLVQYSSFFSGNIIYISSFTIYTKHEVKVYSAAGREFLLVL